MLRALPATPSSGCIFVTALLIFAGASNLHPETRVRTEPRLPEKVLGYRVLRCDFHMHTVFSDGNVWPTTRAEEAWREGLDAFAITDHIEYQPHKEDVQPRHHRPYQIAKRHADSLGIIIVRSAEITRKLPPGHFNTLFLQDEEALATDDWRQALGAAAAQGAFIFWNHPPFQQPEAKSVWYAEHTEIHGKGWMQGIEVVNGNSYYPEAQRWCQEKKLTMIALLDAHDPTSLIYDRAAGEHRPMTLVLAKDRSSESLKEALRARRTVVYWKDRLIGDATYLKALFEASIEVVPSDIVLGGRRRAFLQVRNRSEVPFEIELAGEVKDARAPDRAVLSAGKTVLLDLRASGAAAAGKRTVRLPYRVLNLLVAPQKGLQVEIPVEVRFTKKS